MIEEGFKDEVDSLQVATVHWLRHTGISDDVKRHLPITEKDFIDVSTAISPTHPDLAIRVGDRWKNIYSLFNIDHFLINFRQLLTFQASLRKNINATTEVL